MDGFGQIGPDKPGYQDDAKRVATMLCGAPVAVVLAHRMTRIEVVLTLGQDVSMPGGRIEGLEDRNNRSWPWVMVAVRGKGMEWFQCPTHPSFVSEKLGGMNLVDAETVTNFVNAVMENYTATFAESEGRAPLRPVPSA